MRRTDERRAAVFACYQGAVTGARLDEVLESGGSAPMKGDGDAATERPATPASAFTRELAAGVAEHREELDGLIAAHAIGWDLERIAPLERCIMRVALYEVLYSDDVPREVALDEAVETAKLYCGSEAPGFVNGILGSVVKGLDREGDS